MRQLWMKYSKEKAAERKSKRISLENSVKQLEIKISTNSNEELLGQYYKAKNELEALYDYITEGVILCSKTDWYEHGEKSSKYFLNLEERNKSKSHMRNILTSSSQETSNQTEILYNIRSYYSSLYKRRSNKSESDCLSYLTNLNLSKLSEDQQNLCEGKLRRRECWEALLSMGSNKSPGSDGLSKEFYICFFDEIITHLLDALNLAFDQGQLSNFQRQAMITSIEKKSKDKRYLKNWRPISLINVDAKIASKALAFRIRKVITNLIHSDQTAYVKGGYIRESVLLSSDILTIMASKLFCSRRILRRLSTQLTILFYFLSSSHMGSVLTLFNGSRHYPITRKVV